MLVSVDLSLTEAPLGKRLGVRPHGDLAGLVNELEVARHALEDLVLLSMLDADFKERILLTLAVSVLLGNTSKLLVGWVVR